MDKLIYKDKSNTLQVTLYRKATDQQSYLHAHSDLPKSLKISIPDSQALRIKTICSTLNEYKKHCAILKQNFIERAYKENILKDQINKVDNIDRKDLLSKKEKIIKDRIPCLITCNRKLPMMHKIINKHWNVLQINQGLPETFQNNPLVAYKRNKNLQEITGGHTIKNGKVLKVHSKNRKGKCEPCNTSKPSLCCDQVIDTSTFRSYQRQQLYTIFHKLNCKIKFIIYLMNCVLCKVQYLGKAETAFNIRLNNHRKDVNNPKSIHADLHLRKPGYLLNLHAKFALIEQLSNINHNHKKRKELQNLQNF